MALLCAFLKILSMMFFQFKDLIPTIKGLLAPPDELKGLMAEKERDADLSTLLLDLLKTEESQSLLTQAIELIDDDVTKSGTGGLITSYDASQNIDIDWTDGTAPNE